MKILFASNHEESDTKFLYSCSSFKKPCIVTYRINSNKLKVLFTSNHEETDTKFLCSCSSFNKPCKMKAQDTDILILMIYAYAVQQPSTIGTWKQTKILLLVLEKFMKNLAVPLACCWHSFMQSRVVILLITSIIFQN